MAMGQQLCHSWVPGSYWELGPHFIEVRFVRRAPSQPRGGKRAASGGRSAERRPVGDRWESAADGEKVSLIISHIYYIVTP
jgi:hypothetical protein